MSEQTPSPGRIVLYYEGDHDALNYGQLYAPGGVTHKGTNGTRIHPAIITRVWSDGWCNLIVFLDAHGPVMRHSIMHAASLPKAGEPTAGVWVWPRST